jgi:hypothetical protein
MDQFRVARAVFAGLASVTLAAFLSVPVVAHAEACVNGTVQRGGSGGDYFLCQGGAWLHVVPTLDPHSADGYGPESAAAAEVCEVPRPIQLPDRRPAA